MSLATRLRRVLCQGCERMTRVKEHYQVFLTHVYIGLIMSGNTMMMKKSGRVTSTMYGYRVQTPLILCVFFREIAMFLPSDMRWLKKQN